MLCGSSPHIHGDIWLKIIVGRAATGVLVSGSRGVVCSSRGVVGWGCPTSCSTVSVSVVLVLASRSPTISVRVVSGLIAGAKGVVVVRIQSSGVLVRARLKRTEATTGTSGACREHAGSGNLRRCCLRSHIPN
jgi:hypothetical protein